MAQSRTSPSSTGPIADRPGADDVDDERQHGYQAANGPGSGDWFRAPAPGAGSGGDHRFRQPRHHRRAVHRQRVGPRAGDSKDLGRWLTSLYNAIYIALKDLKKIVARNVEEIRRRAIVVLRTAKTRRAFCRSKKCWIWPSVPRPQSTRSVFEAPTSPRAKASRRPSSPCGSSRRKPAARLLPQSGARSREDLRRNFGRAVESA